MPGLAARWKNSLSLLPEHSSSAAPGSPLATEEKSLVEPDTSEVFAIIHEMIDPSGSIAQATLQWIEGLWNQRWEGGGLKWLWKSENGSPAIRPGMPLSPSERTFSRVRLRVPLLCLSRQSLPPPLTLPIWLSTFFKVLSRLSKPR